MTGRWILDLTRARHGEAAAANISGLAAAVESLSVTLVFVEPVGKTASLVAALTAACAAADLGATAGEPVVIGVIPHRELPVARDPARGPIMVPRGVFGGFLVPAEGGSLVIDVTGRPIPRGQVIARLQSVVARTRASGR